MPIRGVPTFASFLFGQFLVAPSGLPASLTLNPMHPLLLLLLLLLLLSRSGSGIFICSLSTSPFQLVRAHFHEKRHGYQAKQNGELWQVTLLNSSALEF